MSAATETAARHEVPDPFPQRANRLLRPHALRRPQVDGLAVDDLTDETDPTETKDTIR